MIAVTIGVGERHKTLAQYASGKIKRHYGIAHTIILGRHQVDKYCPPQERFGSAVERIFFLKLCVPLIVPGTERWMYFDADYAPVQDAEPGVLDVFRSDSRFIAVQDKGVEPHVHPYAPVYYNAGFYVANMVEHAPMFAWARENYWAIPKRWDDQCATNVALNHCKKPVLELSYRYNATYPGRCEDPIGVHGFWYPRPD